MPSSQRGVSKFSRWVPRLRASHRGGLGRETDRSPMLYPDGLAARRRVADTIGSWSDHQAQQDRSRPFRDFQNACVETCMIRYVSSQRNAGDGRVQSHCVRLPLYSSTRYFHTPLKVASGISVVQGRNYGQYASID